MAVLKHLAFTAMSKASTDPAFVRRVKFIEKLEEQKQLLEDPGYVRTVQRMTEVDGIRQARGPPPKGPALVKDRPVRPARHVDQVRGQGHRFEKGKAGIAVPSKEKLPEVIDTLIAAVPGGVLDDHFAQASKLRQMPTGKK